MNTSQQLADIYQEISIYEQELKTITMLCEQLITGDKEIVIGFSVIEEDDTPKEDPKTALVSSTLGMLAIQVNPLPQSNPTGYTWVVNESTAIRILNVIHDSIKYEIKQLKKNL